MRRRHRTPEYWHLPTPLKDSAGGRITIRLGRPTLHSVVFLIGLLTLARAGLAGSPVENGTGPGWLSDTACVLAAVAGGCLVGRLGSADRTGRICAGTLGLVGLMVGGGSAPPPVSGLIAPVAMVGALTLANEIGYRASVRRSAGRTGDED